jgi:hypothetical protein
VSNDIQGQLNEAIAAARAGDAPTARRLLEAVLAKDRYNDTAWVWMAALASRQEDKKRYLERAVSSNPNNEIARQGLKQLGMTAEQLPIRTAPPPSDNRNLIFFGIIGAVIVSIALIVIAVYSIITTARSNFTPQQVAEFQTQTEAAIPTVTLTPSPIPSVTVAAIFVPLDQAQRSTLPPTFTPTPTLTPVATIPPSPTGLPPASYNLLYTRQSLRAASPQLVQSAGDGSNSSAVGFSLSDFAISPDGQQVAYIQAVNDVPEIFVAPLADPASARQLTELGATTLQGVSWSPNGSAILFVQNELTLAEVAVSNGDIRVILDSDASGVKRDPVWSPDGSKIALAADADTPGFSEVYVWDVAAETLTRLSDDAGSSYAPSWSPDGTLIAFISDRAGDGDLYVMESGGGATRLLTLDDAGAEDQAPAWSADGRFLAFSSNRTGNFHIYLIEPQGGFFPFTVTTGSENFRAPAFR